MPGSARSVLLLLTVSLCCRGLSADTAKDAWKKCKKAGRTETEIKLRECSIAIETGALSNNDVSEAHLLRASGYIGTGDYERAIKDLDESTRLTPSSWMSFSNRGWAYLGKFDYEYAIQDFDRAIQLDPKNSYAYANRGIAEFLLGNFGAAKDDFAQNQRLSPKVARPYSGLERLLALMREGKEKVPSGSVKFEGDLTQWPGPVVGFYLGIGSQETVLHAADSRYPAAKKSRLCQAYFFLGERALLDGNREKAMQFLQQSVDTGAMGDPEYVWARGELHNLQSVNHKGSAHSESESNPNPQDSTAKTALESPTNPIVATAPPPKSSEHHTPDPAAILPGSSTREEIRRDWACCDAHVESNRLFVATMGSEHGKIKYLLVGFDDKGVVSGLHVVSPDDMVREAVAWARRAPEPLDLSSPREFKPLIIAFGGSWQVKLIPGPITLSSDGLRFGPDGNDLQLKPSQLSKFRQCGETKVGLHATCTGFGWFGVDVDAYHPGTQVDVSGLSGIGSHLHILMDVPDLFTFVRYLRQTAPVALGASTEN